MPLNDPIQMILEAKRLVESERRSEIRLKANGGNSILLVCDPLRETEYIAHLKEILPEDNFKIIDLNSCLIDFITNHESELSGLYDMLQSATHEIYRAPAGEESPDLFKEIMRLILQTFQESKVPVLINSGSLYGTGIHNIHIMESDTVMKAELPIILLYPATIEPDRIMFLGKHPASRYRCLIIQ